MPPPPSLLCEGSFRFIRLIQFNKFISTSQCGHLLDGKPTHARRPHTSLSRTQKMSIFSQVPLAAPDPILGTAIAFKLDTNPAKVNLGIGAYRTDEGMPYVFS